MIELKYKSWGDALPLGMPKVFFSCYPDDFERTFHTICEDIFRTLRCVVYYTADMTAEITPEQRLTDLREMSLFVIPVTMALLSKPNRAMNIDLSYALENRIPVLPIMMDDGLDTIYSREDRFGNLHYLSQSETNQLGFSYPEKLQQYLESIFIVDEVSEAIEKAFDAQMFMSYRHVDRLASMEFMHIFHQITRFRDIAIWYDDFLVPGEDFKNALRNKIYHCDLFSLIVTPNLANNPDSYVLKEEYPDACKAGKPVLAVEMIQTDRDALQNINGLNEKDLEDPHNALALEQSVSVRMPNKSLGEHLDDPFRQFLMGSAYMTGFHVEVDRDRAVQLLLAAAEANELNAQRKVRNMYESGQGVLLDYKKEVYWAEQYAKNCEVTLGENHDETLSAHHDLANSYHHVGRYRDELAQWESLYAKSLQLLGKDNPKVWSLQINIAACYDALGDCQRAFELSKEAYVYVSDNLGEESCAAIVAQGNMAHILCDLDKIDQAIKISEDVCKKSRRVFGNEHPLTLYYLNNHACYLIEIGKVDEAEEILKDIYPIRKRILGADHPRTIDTIHNLAWVAREKRDYDNSLSFEKQAFEMRSRILGFDHPETHRSLSSLMETCHLVPEGYKVIESLTLPAEEAYLSACHDIGETDSSTIHIQKSLTGVYFSTGQYQKAYNQLQKTYKKCLKILGETNLDTVGLLYDITHCLIRLGKFDEALDKILSCYERCRQILGEADPTTISTLLTLATVYDRAGYSREAFETDQKAYKQSIKTFGEDHPETLSALHNLAAGYCLMDDLAMALKLSQQTYEKRSEVLGETHPDTILTMSRLSHYLMLNGFLPEALEMGKRAYYLMSRYYGKKDLNTLRALVNVSRCQYMQHQFDDALESSMIAYNQYCNLFSESYPDAIDALGIAAGVYRETGNPIKALELDKHIYHLALEVYSKKDNPAIISIIIHIVMDYITIGDGESALQHSQEAYRLQRQTCDEGDPSVLTIFSYIGMSYGLLGEHNKAIEFFNKCIDGFLERCGENDIQTLQALYSSAYFAWEKLDDTAYALQRAEKAYMLGRLALGKDHPFVRSASALLKNIRIQQFDAHQEQHSVIDAIRSVKASRKYDQLLINHEGEQAAQAAIAAYAPKADLSMGFAVQPIGFRLFGLGRTKGILLTNSTFYSNQLPPDGIPYKEIRKVKSEDNIVHISLFDTKELHLDLGAFGPDVAAVLQAACVADLSHKDHDSLEYIIPLDRDQNINLDPNDQL